MDCVSGFNILGQGHILCRKNMNDLSILGKSHTFDFSKKTNDLKLIGSMSSDIKYKVRTHIRRSLTIVARWVKVVFRDSC